MSQWTDTHTQTSSFQIKVTIDDRRARQVINGMPDRINLAMWAAKEEMGEALLEVVTPYPPEIEGQKYVRTGNLMRGWRVARRHRGRDRVELQLKNNMRYTRFVKDERAQQPVHIGRHLTVQDAMRQVEPEMYRILSRYMSRV